MLLPLPVTSNSLIKWRWRTHTGSTPSYTDWRRCGLLIVLAVLYHHMHSRYAKMHWLIRSNITLSFPLSPPSVVEYIKVSHTTLGFNHEIKQHHRHTRMLTDMHHLFYLRDICVCKNIHTYIHTYVHTYIHMYIYIIYYIYMNRVTSRSINNSRFVDLLH